MDGKPPVVIKGRSIQRARTRPRASLNRPPRFRSSRVAGENNKEEGKTTSLIIKTVIAAMITLFVLLLNTIKLPFTQGVITHIKTALTYEMDFEKIPNNLKFVGDFIPSLRSVFGNQDKVQSTLRYLAPSNGSVIRLFNNQTDVENRNYGIDILATDNINIYACAPGRIASIEEHEVYGLALWMDHGDGQFSFYGGIDALNVKQGQIVEGGSMLGTIAALEDDRHMLHFEIWIGDEPVDPLEKIQEENKVIQRGV